MALLPDLLGLVIYTQAFSDFVHLVPGNYPRRCCRLPFLLTEARCRSHAWPAATFRNGVAGADKNEAEHVHGSQLGSSFLSQGMGALTF